MNFKTYLAEVLISLNGIANITYIILIMLLPLLSVLFYLIERELIYFKRNNLKKLFKLFYLLLFISFLIVVFFPTDESIRLLLGVNNE